ncbi:MAG: hypothetical protein A2Z51_10375 [Deltaproteobacteria bacterium RBG_19FT_COMBO_52_11]|nr:MAG: hypothetical protein A2Z51_10375 [Deltaproteobacteria bacterium RBG_19FT_COMBO_52_11]
MEQQHYLFRIISNLVGRSHQSSLLVARAKEQTPKTKRAGIKPSHFPPYFLSAKRRGGKGVARHQGAEARIGERGTSAFFGEANAFLPGDGTTWPYGKASIHRTD